MLLRRQIQKGFISSLMIFAILFNGIIPANAQGDFVTSGRIGGGSSVYVFRTSSKQNKSIDAPRRRSKVKRTTTQRRATRQTIVRQSKVVAKKNRVRRNIKKVTPTELEEVQVERKTPQEASKILAGAGEYFVERDEYEKAVGYLEQAVELDDANNDAKLALSEVYTVFANETVDKADEFATLAAQALKENRSDDVRKYLTQEKFATQKVEKDLNRAIELDPKNSTAYAALGEFYDDQEKDDDAQKMYEKALSLDPSLSNVKAPLGILYYQKGMIAESEKYINEAIEGGADNAETQYFRGLILYKKQNQDELAKKALEKSLSLDDDNAEAHYYLGATLGRLGMDDRAIEEYKKSTSLDPTFVNAWFDLGVAYYNKGMYDDAIDAFDNAIKLNKAQTDEEKRIYSESFANLAETYRQTEQYDKAITKYRVAVARINDSELLSTFAFVLAKKGLWRDAISTFEKVTQMTPDAISFANLGWAYYQESQYHLSYRYFDKQKASLEKAKTALETAISKDPRFAPPYLNLGITLNDLGKHKEAIPVLQKAVDLQKNWTFAVNELGIAYRKDGNLDKGIDQFEKAIDMDKKYAFAYFNLGDTQSEKGNRKEADKALKELKKLDKKLAAELEDNMRKRRF